jgi:hypothetical protein
MSVTMLETLPRHLLHPLSTPVVASFDDDEDDDDDDDEEDEDEDEDDEDDESFIPQGELPTWAI